jgi:hypothetical protein
MYKQNPELDEMGEALLSEVREEIGMPEEVDAPLGGDGGGAGTPKTDLGYVSRWGSGSGNLAWQEFLHDLVPDPYLEGRGPGPPRRPSYHHPHRKLAAFDEVTLPVPRRGKRGGPRNTSKPRVVIAIDTSGSLKRDQARQLISLAKSIPKRRAELYVCSFTTEYTEINLQRPEFPIGYTNLSAIEEFIQDRVIRQRRGQDRYPQAVIVMTDGKSTFNGIAPEEKYHTRWNWLLTEKPQPSLKELLPGTIRSLRDFVR